MTAPHQPGGALADAQDELADNDDVIDGDGGRRPSLVQSDPDSDTIAGGNQDAAHLVLSDDSSVGQVNIN